MWTYLLFVAGNQLYDPVGQSPHILAYNQARHQNRLGIFDIYALVSPLLFGTKKSLKFLIIVGRIDHKALARPLGIEH